MALRNEDLPEVAFYLQVGENELTTIYSGAVDSSLRACLTANIDIDHLLRHGSRETQIHFAETTFHLYNRGDDDSRIFLDRAITLYESALPRFPDTWGLKSRYLGLLGLALSEKGLTERAEHVLEQCLALANNNESKLPSFILKLFGLITERLTPDNTTWPTAAIERLVDLSKRLVELSPHDDKNLPVFLKELARTLLLRFGRKRNFDDVRLAIQHGERAAAAAPEDPGVLMVLSLALTESYIETHDIAQIDRAIELAKRGRTLKAVVSETPEERAADIHNLANAFGLRFHHFGEDNDSLSCITYHEEAFALIPHSLEPAHWRVAALCNYTIALNAMFKRTRDVTYSDRCIAELEAALLTMSRRHPDRPVLLGNLGVYLLTKHERIEGQPEALVRRAIDVFKDGLDGLPSNHSFRPFLLFHLGTAMSCLDSLTHSDVNTYISCLREANDLTPNAHPSKPLHQFALGSALADLWNLDKTSNDALIECIIAYQQCANSSVGDINKRFESAIHWAEAANILGDEKSCFDAYRRAMDLISSLAWIGGSIAQQHRQIRRAPMSSIGRTAARIAISLHEYPAALEWLEQTRSIVWGKMLNIREPIDDLLRNNHPALAQRLDAVTEGLAETGALLNSPMPFQPQNLSQDQVIDKYHRLAEEWEALVTKIRRESGLQNFLRPKQLDDLRAAARGGPVIVLNVHDFGCNALILKDEWVLLHLRLPFTEEDATALQLKLRTSLLIPSLRSRGGDQATQDSTGAEHSERASRLWYPDAHKQFPYILSTLWTKIAKPVLDALEISVHNYSGSSTPPRLTWCPTGPLAFLPLHAAGLYNTQAEGTKVYEYVVSSYAPTLSILARAYDKHLPQDHDFQGIFAVSQPHTPMQTAIPKTEDEVVAIVASVMNNGHAFDVQWLNGAEATREAVLSRMQDHSWIHLACHASQHPSEPTHSAFMLDDGPLTLEEIAARRLPHAELAFLSACQTATGDEQLSEEAIHLAGGMLAAGFRSVVATMWSVRDKDAPYVAERVYTNLLEGGRIDRTGTGLALHDATRALREKVGENDFLFWVPFIHVGV